MKARLIINEIKRGEANALDLIGAGGKHHAPTWYALKAAGFDDPAFFIWPKTGLLFKIRETIAEELDLPASRIAVFNRLLSSADAHVAADVMERMLDGITGGSKIVKERAEIKDDADWSHELTLRINFESLAALVTLTTPHDPDRPPRTYYMIVTPEKIR